MKIRGHIHSASDVGDALEITGQGFAATDGEIQSMRTFSLRIPSNSKNMRAFHIGRAVHITIEAK